MIARIQKWGNSLAVRIPKAFADEMKVAENASIQMMLKDGALLLTPIAESMRDLEGFLAAVTEENLHAEWETGKAMGKEQW